MALVLEIVLGALILGGFRRRVSRRSHLADRSGRVGRVRVPGRRRLLLPVSPHAPTHQAWGKALNQAEKETQNQEKRLLELQQGGGTPVRAGNRKKAFAKLRHDLERLALDRGGVCATSKSRASKTAPCS